MELVELTLDDDALSDATVATGSGPGGGGGAPPACEVVEDELDDAEPNSEASASVNAFRACANSVSSVATVDDDDEEAEALDEAELDDVDEPDSSVAIRLLRSVSKVDSSELMLEELELDDEDDALELDAPGGGPGGGPPAGAAPGPPASLEPPDDEAPSCDRKASTALDKLTLFDASTVGVVELVDVEELELDWLDALFWLAAAAACSNCKRRLC